MEGILHEDFKTILKMFKELKEDVEKEKNIRCVNKVKTSLKKEKT